MKTTKSYLAGLGMTGIVIASILSLLVVGTGLVAFESTPEPGTQKGPLERVVVEDKAGAAENGTAKQRKWRGLRALTAAGGYRLASRIVAAEQRQGAPAGQRANGRRAARRRSRGHGGAQVEVAGRLGGGVAAGDSTAESGRPSHDARAPGGGVARSRPDRLGRGGNNGAGGGVPVRGSVGVPRAVPGRAQDAIAAVRGGVRSVRPPGLRR